MTSPNDAQKREHDARKRKQNEMVKTAAALTASVEKLDPMPRALATADSSGFVDMSAFSASDPDWVENALATARGEDAKRSERPKPTPTVRGILLAPQTLRPVALSEILAPPAKTERRMSAFAAGAMGAFIAIAVGGLALSRVGRGPDALADAAISDALRDAALGSLVAPAAAPEMSSAPIASALPPPPVPATSSTAVVAAKPTTKPSAIGAAPPARPSPAPASKPRTASTGGSPSLEEMMRRAAQPPAKPKK